MRVSLRMGCLMGGELLRSILVSGERVYMMAMVSINSFSHMIVKL